MLETAECDCSKFSRPCKMGNSHTTKQKWPYNSKKKLPLKRKADSSRLIRHKSCKFLLFWTYSNNWIHYCSTYDWTLHILKWVWQDASELHWLYTTVARILFCQTVWAIRKTDRCIWSIILLLWRYSIAIKHPAFNSRLAQWYTTLTKNNDQISESSSGLFSEIKKSNNEDNF